MNFSDWPVYYYVIAGCGLLLVLAIILYFVPGGRIKLSGMTSCGLVSLVAGIGLGVLTMIGFGYHWEVQPTSVASASTGGGGPGGPGGGAGGRGGPPAGERKGGAGAKGSEAKEKEKPKTDKDSTAKDKSEKKEGGGDMMSGMQAMGRATMGNVRPTPPKDRLVALVGKLDILTQQTPLIKLTDDQKSKIREQLNGLDKKDEINDDEAEKILAELLDIVEGERKFLVLVGFQYPGAGGDFPRPVPNPFKYKANADHLENLRKQLTSKGGS